ncbi:flagella synthesis protein FlgN [Gilvimarinus chinensis]|uniref:flagella synthesis protein FlgN n=1 Tax=Gilvimarinus chinensis TaxID=396005 RepID=UPI00036F76B4|nr:flagellar protein FlgN [Gilvimarinus chinensis]
MSVNPQLVQQMITRDQQAAEQLLQLLEQESETLKQRDSQALADLVNAKSEHISVLEAHSSERSALLQSLSLNGDSDGWLSYMNSNPQLKPLIPAWEDFQRILARCKERNEINGKLIGRSQQTLKRLVNLIKGKPESGELYNAKGNTTNNSLSNTVTEA